MRSGHAPSWKRNVQGRALKVCSCEPLRGSSLVPDLNGAFPSGKKASLLKGGGVSICAKIFSCPAKPPSRSPPVRLTFCIAHFKPASIGVMVSFRSCPYRQSPHSSLRVSLAPSPIASTSLIFSRFLQKISAPVLLIEAKNEKFRQKSGKERR